MKPIEALGLGPTYVETWEAIEGKWLIEVTPGMNLGPAQQLTLDEDQYERYSKWRRGEGLIQEMLPELSVDDRELLLSGLVW